MHPILFHFGSVTIYSFGLFLALGIVCGSLVIALLSKRARVSMHGLFDTILFILFGSIVGARVAYIVVYPHFFFPPSGTISSIFALWQGGLLFYGAFVGGLFAAWFSFRKDGSLWRWLDLLSLGLFFGLFFGQIGCFLGGCANGIANTGKLAINGAVPVQLFEAVVDIALFAAALYVYTKKSHWRRGGLVFVSGGLVLFTSRLLLDFWRPSPIQWHHNSALLVTDVLWIALFCVFALVRSKRFSDTSVDFER